MARAVLYMDLRPDLVLVDELPRIDTDPATANRPTSASSPISSSGTTRTGSTSSSPSPRRVVAVAQGNRSPFVDPRMGGLRPPGRLRPGHRAPLADGRLKVTTTAVIQFFRIAA